MLADLPLHPVLVHLPLALAVLMPLVAGGVLAAWWRGALQNRAWAVVVAGQAMLVGSGWLAMQSGERDEEVVERVVAESAIEHHEEAAEAFEWAAVAVLLLSIAPLLLKKPRVAQFTALASAVGTLTVLGLAFRVGEAGGELVYRHGAASAFVDAGGATAVPAAAQRGDDDDR